MKTLLFSLVLLALFASGLTGIIDCPPCGEYETCDYDNYTCVCQYGFTGGAGNCVDIDECLDTSTCEYIEGSMCENTNGSYECVCDLGYTICNSSCAMDTCPSDCGSNTYCGCGSGYLCQCYYGYTSQAGSCEDINECLDSSACDYIDNGVCTNYNGSFSCDCEPGYIICYDTYPYVCTIDSACPTCGFNEYCGCETDFECRCNDELVGGVCAGNQTCPPCDNGYCTGYPDYECRCDYGFELVYGVCVDIDECADECNSYCSYPEGSVCYNTYGSYECVCPPGYVNCYSSNKCIYNETCPSCGSYEVCNCGTDFVCECDYGFTRDADGYCEDIDECNDNYTCSYMEGTVCYNTYGSYDCLCLPGYTQCYENSQCTLNGICSECGNDSYCGCSTDFECRCNYGYTGMSGFCEDIDECEDNYTCAYREGTVCYNTIGSYDCLCQEGYIMCYYSYECTPNATCPDCGVNEYCSCETDFQCRCNYGFTGVDGSCEDIDECYPYNPCQSGMECTNTYGSYECSCPPGYFYCSTLYQCVSIYEPARLEPTVLEDRFGCYPYDTMDERRDIRCTVRSIIQEKINLLFNDGFPDEGPTDPTSFPTGTPVSPTGTTEYPTDTSGGSSGTSSGSSGTSGGSSGTSGGSSSTSETPSPTP